MIGVGNICFRRNGKIELHVTGIETLFAIREHLGYEATDQQVIDFALANGAREWKPDRVISESTFKRIKRATNCIKGRKNYHELAGDYNFIGNWSNPVRRSERIAK